MVTSFASIRVFESDVVTLIVSYLNAKDVFQSLQYVNKSTLLFTAKATLWDPNSTSGALPVKSAILFEELRRAAISVHLMFNPEVGGKYSKAAQQLFSQQRFDEFFQDPQFDREIRRVSLEMFYCWNHSLSSTSEGVAWKLISLPKKNPQNFGCFKDAILHDCIYWRQALVNDEFFVLFDREDGTIVVSSDYQRVYLVLALFQGDSIGTQASRIKYTHGVGFHGIPGTSTTPSRTFISLHGKFIGLKMSLMLLNWEDRIISDGLVVPTEVPSKTAIKRAIAAYYKALDEKTLITKLSKKARPHEHDFNLLRRPTQPDCAVEQVAYYLENYAEDFEYLRATYIYGSHTYLDDNENDNIQRPPKYMSMKKVEVIPLEEVYFVRRSFYVEDQDDFREGGNIKFTNRHITNNLPDNGSYEFVVESPRGIVTRTTTGAPIPTIPDYIGILTAVINGTNKRPTHVAIDAPQQYDLLQALLGNYGILVSLYYYPDNPSAALTYADNLKSVVVKHCAFCGLTNQANGEALLLCSRCKSGRYCCADHQKQHWKDHKAFCSVVKPQS